MALHCKKVDVCYQLKMGFNLKNIPQELQTRLLEEYKDAKRLYILNEARSSGLNSGRFAECVLRILQNQLDGSYTPFGTDIVAAEKTRILNRVTQHINIDPHIRQKVTSLVRILLDFRNNRDIAHLGGFNPSYMDVHFIISCVKWIMAELLRVYGDYTPTEAEKIVSSITIHNYPIMFNVDGEDFISNDKLKSKDEILVILYINSADFNYLFQKTKDSHKKRFEKTLKALCTEKKIVLKENIYYIMPLGIKYVEENKLLNF